MAIGTQVGFALGGFAPTISAAILQPGPTGWMPVALFTTAVTLVAAISAATARETFRTPMKDLGHKAPAGGSGQAVDVRVRHA